MNRIENLKQIQKYLEYFTSTAISRVSNGDKFEIFENCKRDIEYRLKRIDDIKNNNPNGNQEFKKNIIKLEKEEIAINKIILAYLEYSKDD